LLVKAMMFATRAHPFSPPRRRAVAGFTFIELMVVLAVAAVLMAVAAPSFNDLILSQRAKTAAFSFVNTAVMARSEAIKRNADVVMTANAGGWQNGWSLSAGGNVLSQQEAFTGGVVITSSVTQLTYQSSGRLSAAVGAVQVSGASASHARCISFDLSGLPKSRMGAC
jgi:type IV fimbrial biogenesis protein FimT